MKNIFFILLITILQACKEPAENPEVIALWLFDEQTGLYPSCVLSDQSDNDYPLVLGPGAQIVSGKFGNALEPVRQTPIKLPESHSVSFGMERLPIPEGRTVEPLTWHNALFAALMTCGENHLRKKVHFANPTETGLNLGDFDWTVEFWLQINKSTKQQGTVFEIGTGPRAENDKLTRLSLTKDLNGFVLHNQPAALSLSIPSRSVFTDVNQLQWHHFAFVYDAAAEQITHYVDGKQYGPPSAGAVRKLETGPEAYMSVGRDGRWQTPLQGKLDELRFSKGKVYTSDFTPPGSFSELAKISEREIRLQKSPPLLFSERRESQSLPLGGRKILFIDDAFFENATGVSFTVNPPRKAERVIDRIQGTFRKHLSVVEDEDGLLRVYHAVSDDFLAVRTSLDGIHWQIPDLPGGHYKNHTNIVIHEPTGMGVVFIDPNAPAQERWKYVTGFQDRGIFLYISPDGYRFKRRKTAVLPLWPGSQSNIFYDDQQQAYIAYHRADFSRGAGGSTQREFVMTKTKNIDIPWDFKPSTQAEGIALSRRKRVKDLLPFYLDNGPLTPGGFAFEYPVVFTPKENFDPADTDIYVPKAIKYPWAPDVYLAFPAIYFHYNKTDPVTRLALQAEKYGRGSGPLETQLSVSRDAVHWQRYPRPAYIGIGKHENRKVMTAYIAQGLVRRADEIWQYYFGETQYHSAIRTDPQGRAVYRLVQRLDGFVSVDSPYDREVEVVTKPFTFIGNRLVLNIDTDAAGYVQVGFLDENHKPIEGFHVDDCIYINGDFMRTPVEWLKNRAALNQVSDLKEAEPEQLSKKLITVSNVSALAGKTVRLVFRMRGSKLYAMQFVDK